MGHDFLAVAAMLQMYLTPGRVFGIIPVVDSVVGTLYYKNQFAAMMELAAPIALWRVYNGRSSVGGLCYRGDVCRDYHQRIAYGGYPRAGRISGFFDSVGGRAADAAKSAVAVVAISRCW